MDVRNDELIARYRKKLCFIRNWHGLSRLWCSLFPSSWTNTNKGKDTLLQRNRQVLGFEAASHRDIANLQNWINGNRCIARQETAYLAQHEDFLHLISPDDKAKTWLGELIEDTRIFLHGHFGKLRKSRFRSLMDTKRNIGAWAPCLERSKRAHIPSVSSCGAARILIIPLVIEL